jgi:hypothetical protein
VRIRSLNLKREVKPDNAPTFAGDIMASTARVTGDALDYSVASLAAVDRIIEGLRAQGRTTDQYAETMFCFGCYVGEVLVRHAGGRWVATPEDQLRLFGVRLIVEFPSGQRCNPIAKAFKRLHNGVADHLPFFYAAFTQPPQGSVAVPPGGTATDADPAFAPDRLSNGGDPGPGPADRVCRDHFALPPAGRSRAAPE